MKFLHTSDWQIGKSFRFADDTSQVLRDERLDVITRLGKLAMDQNVTDILVAGDVYDVETPSERTLRQPVERMRAFAGVHWHLIPGNHDADTPRGPWQRLARMGAELPANIHPHLAQIPFATESGAFILPSVLTRRHAAQDVTAWMDEAATPAGAIRLGLAHGSITDFGSATSVTHNRIAPDRPARAGLDYLALGDWHGAQQISPRCCYSGTPEIDDFNVGGDGDRGGEALLVEIEGAGALPVVTRHRVGRFIWHRERASLHDEAGIDALEARLRALSQELGNVLVWLEVSGALKLAARAAFEQRIQVGVGSALRLLRLDDAGLLAQPSDADLAAIDHAGFVRLAADRLAEAAAGPAGNQADLAAAALQRLYVLTVQTPKAGNIKASNIKVGRV